MPERLKLHRGGRLIKTPWDQAPDNPADFVTEDVSEQATLYLLEPVAFDEELRLIDLFALLRKDETLQHIFSRELAKEFLSAAFKLEAAPHSPPNNAEGIEYLLLYNKWSRNTKANELHGLHLLDFSGMGFVLEEDNPEFGAGMGKAGTRIKYGLSLTPVKDIVNLPLRYLALTIIREEDIESDDYYNELDKILLPNPTLGLVIQSVFSELSWHGAPENSQKVHDELMGRAAEARDILGLNEDV